MKLTLAIILTAALALFFIVTTIPPYDFSSYFSTLFFFISLLGSLLGLCILPWLKGSFSEIWVPSLRYGMFTAFLVFDLGYLTSALSTLI
ncbi:MAG: hypothetical protein HOP31_03230 [Ignavibacteria bacterium]|nr:hypothetical protein [Ignavibacteria bacterium]